MSFEEQMFKTNPNFCYKETIFDKGDCLSGSYLFDVYRDKDNEVKVIAPYFDVNKAAESDNHISIINLRNNEVVKELKGHKDRVISVRYFQDPKTKRDLLISSDRKQNVIVWDLSNDGSKEFEVETKYEGFIYSCYLIFDESKILAVTSSIGSNSVTKVYNIKEAGSVMELNDSKNLNVYYVDYWYNENGKDNNEKHVIIQCAKNKVLFTNYPSNTTYYTMQTDDNFPYILTGKVFKNKGRDMFAWAASYGLIKIVDLASLSSEKKDDIKIKEIEMKDDVHLCGFVRWNEHYLLLNDCAQRRVIVIDTDDDYKINSKVLCPEMHFEKFILKVDHPLYGESLLSEGIDYKLKLFVNRNLVVTKENK